MQARAEHYRETAARSRRLAKRISDADARAHMLEVAAQYDKSA
jgi:hypothetical protein